MCIRDRGRPLEPTDGAAPEGRDADREREQAERGATCHSPDVTIVRVREGPLSDEIRIKSMSKALSGIRVVDITNNQAGPSCGQMLAWLGADVIKVEEPLKGDPARETHRDRPDADSLFYLSFNGNKRSLTLNLKNDGAKDVFRALLKTADVPVSYTHLTLPTIYSV